MSLGNKPQPLASALLPLLLLACCCSSVEGDGDGMEMGRGSPSVTLLGRTSMVVPSALRSGSRSKGTAPRMARARPMAGSMLCLGVCVCGGLWVYRVTILNRWRRTL